MLFICGFSLSVSAQKSQESDTLVYYLKVRENKKVKVVEKSKDYRLFVFGKKQYYSFLTFDIGTNRLDDSNFFTGSEHESAWDFPGLIESKSRAFAITAMCGRRIVNNFSIVSGMGIEWANYRFNKDITIREIDGVVTQIPAASVLGEISYMKKSKLTGTYLNIPLLLRLDFKAFKAPLANRFFIAAGVIGGFNFNSHTKMVFTDTFGKKQKYKDYDIDLATFKYGYTIRAGFDFIDVYVNYFVSPLFEKNKGPQVYPFSIGVSFSLFD
jgi:hypothetical protein